MKKIIATLLAAFAAMSLAQASSSVNTQSGDKDAQTGPDPMAVEHAFSPDAGAEALVLKVIDASSAKIRLAAYSFNSRPVAEALLKAQKRGVDIKIIVDSRRNLRKNSIAALNSLAKAGIPIRTVSVYAMHHDKYIISDERIVQNGSFNYSNDAATANSENVIVFWNNAELAKSFQNHWDDRWAKGVDYAIRLGRP